MENNQAVVVVGLGEVGRPLLQLLSQHYSNCVGLDVDGFDQRPQTFDVLHVCYPFDIRDFIAETVRYIEKFRPRVTVINSTVAVGTTRVIAERTGAPVVHSPVRGKHIRMVQEISKYTKFVGAIDATVGARVADHFNAAGIKAKVLPTPEATELAKLTETTYFGLLIAWAQELERYCDRAGVKYDDILSFYEEISFFPSTKYFPGVIGGHCVMPNIDILREFNDSEILRAIKSSNHAKIDRDRRQPESLANRSVATA